MNKSEAVALALKYAKDNSIRSYLIENVFLFSRESKIRNIATTMNESKALGKWGPSNEAWLRESMENAADEWVVHLRVKSMPVDLLCVISVNTVTSEVTSHLRCV